MADREADILVRVAASVGEVDASAWNCLSSGDPFLRHAFLYALEESGSVGAGTGWSPAPLMVERNGALAAAALDFCS